MSMGKQRRTQEEAGAAGAVTGERRTEWVVQICTL